MDNAPRNPQVRLPQSRADVATQQQPAKPPTGETSQQQPAKPQATAGTSQPSTSRRQPGLTEDAYKFLDDDWSDEEPDEAEAIDLDEVRKHKSRMQYRGFRKPVATKGKGKAPATAAARSRSRKVFASADTVENSDQYDDPYSMPKMKPKPKPEELPHLDVEDKAGRWRKHYGQVRNKMGNIPPSTSSGCADDYYYIH